MASISQAQSTASFDWRLWRRWVLANAISEMIGLGGSLVIPGIIFAGSTETPVLIIGMAIIAILLGALLEGVIVGYAQWWVLRDVFAGISRRAWMIATALGAGIAWALGMLPSTIMGVMTAPETGSGQMPTEPGAILTLLLAAGMGIVAGPILGIPQWLVLRQHVRRAGWWIAANSLAWAAGMVIVFAIMNALPAGAFDAMFIPLIAGVIFIAGAVVGAVHGVVLVWLSEYKVN